MMTKKEIINLIYLAEKYKGKNDNDILLAVSENDVTGEIGYASFVYSIGKRKDIIPLSRMWDYLLQQAKGKTKETYSTNLKKLAEQYTFPKEYLSQCLYINPENGELTYLET